MIRFRKILLSNEIIVLISFFLYPQLFFGQQYNFSKISIEEGLSSRGVYSICEGPKGRLWIGLEGEGVNIYDGREIIHYSDHHLGQNVRVIFKDSRNKMWFGSSNQGISVLDNKKVFKINTDQGLFVNHIRGITEDRNRNVWAATLGGGVTRIEGYKVTQNISLKDGLPSLNCRAILMRSNGEMWVGTDKGIGVFENGKLLKVINRYSGLSQNKILSLFEDSKGVVWIGTEKGLTLYNQGNFLIINSENGLKNQRIKTITADKSHSVWLGTQTGLGKVILKDFDSKSYKIVWYDDQNGLSNNRIRCLYKDKSGAVWMGTYLGGVNRLFNESFLLHTRQNGLFDNVITALNWNNKDSSLWIGSLDRGIGIWNNSDVKRLSTSSGISNNHITSIAHLNNGATIVGTADGINLIEGYEFSQVWDNYNNIFTSNKISDLVSNGNMVVGMTDNSELFFIRDTGSVFLDRFLSDESAKKFKTYINSVSVIGNNFWIGEDSTLKQIKVVSNRIIILDSLLIGKVVKLAGESGDFVGYTSDNKLFRVVQDTVVWDFEFEKSEEVKFIQKENSRSYWIGLKNKLVNLKFISDEIGYDMKTYSRNEGFMGLSSIRNSVTQDIKNNLYIGSIKGLLQIKPNRYKGVKRDLKVFLNQLVDEKSAQENWVKYSDSIVDGVPLGLVLPYKMNHLSFHYSAYNLKNPGGITYQITLSGDDDFTFETKQTHEKFVDLSPGEYELKIKAKTQWGEWSKQPLIVNFEIQPPIWLTKSFQTLALIVIVGLFVLVFRLRTRKLEKEKIKLEELIAVKTKDLNEEKEKSENLLLNILPEGVANELKLKGFAKTRKYKKASVLFTDFKGFTKMSYEMSPEKLVQKLDEIFVAFDEVIERNNLEKIKTIGDAYMCASGIPDENPNQVKNVVLTGLQLVEVMNSFNEKQRLNNEPEWNVRVGIHTGELIAGVVGKKKFAYDIWGDTVNIASRMESNSEPGRVNVSRQTYEEVRNFFNCEERGRIFARNRGELEMYFVNELKSEFVSSESKNSVNQMFYE
ncbi:MAG: hypothetical protein CMP63_02865 [Flavobacteriales bacterium]|nr:hypothetical protein [Flavobacteriales bacterium]